MANGPHVRAAEFLTKIDMQYATMLFTAWMRSVYGAGVLGDVQRILAIGETRIGKSETLRRMRELAEKAATAPDR